MSAPVSAADAKPAAGSGGGSAKPRGDGRRGGGRGGASGGGARDGGGAGRGGARAAPRAAAGAGEGGAAPTAASAAKEAPAPDTTPGAFRVKSDTNCKKLSGAISAQARAGDHEVMSVNAIGSASVNQAVKAIIIARSNVSEDGFDFAVRPETVAEVGPDAISLKLQKVPERKADATVDEANALRVIGTTAVGAVAGAIAGKAREGAAVLSATGIGPAAVLKIAKGIALARGYVAEDSLDLLAVPRFVELTVGEEARTGVTFDIYAEKKKATAAATAAL